MSCIKQLKQKRNFLQFWQVGREEPYTYWKAWNEVQGQIVNSAHVNKKLSEARYFRL